MSLLIGDKLVVSMDYTLTDEAGNLLDESADSDPMVYLHGAENIVPGLEQALVGKVAGDSLQVKVEPAEGYGLPIPELIQTIDKSSFGDVESIKVGAAFEAQRPDGNHQRIIIKEVNGDEITIDANHPLAGLVLNFDVKIISVREATEEEISHGHAH